MMPKNLLYIALLGITLFSNSGCVAALLIGGGAGAGTVAYLKGELKSTEEASIGNVWQAAHKAMKDLGFVVTSEEKNNLSAKLIAHESDDTKIEIDLESVSAKLTTVKIRVGVFGDESLSRLTLERIRKHL
ncbi:MAG: hypothetical protein UZ01_03346 [Candidatus Brocadia sinica]|nr:MAG: hypothetical protein UZ01_03346 [Candidatus Brocadia sinica]